MEGYIHGSDMLLGIMQESQFVPFGHSKSCTITNNAETKDRATKEISNTGKWKEKSVSGLSVSVSAEGFSFYGDKMGYSTLLKMWEAGKPVKLRYAHRGEETEKYREGDFVITSLEENAPADDDATYSISLENSGPVEMKGVSGGGIGG